MTADPQDQHRPDDRRPDDRRPDDDRPDDDPQAVAAGPGRVLVALYGLFAMAAGARAGVQLATKFSEAPVAYLLSALAAAIYVVALVGLLRGGRVGRRTATIACSIELAGVLAVGTLSLTDRAAFPDATVWSVYGKGYGFVPLVLPVIGLLWLRHRAEVAAEAEEAGAAEAKGEAARGGAQPPSAGPESSP